MPTITPLDLQSYCLFAGFIADIPVFVGANGRILLGSNAPVPLGEGTVLEEGIASVALTRDGRSVLTGGEDGRICRLEADGSIHEIGKAGEKWLTLLATGPKKVFAVASGRMVIVYDGAKSEELPQTRSVEGLAFAPKGICLAIARYNGVNLHWPGTRKKVQELDWKGAHRAVTFSPDGKFVISAMQENALHGWRLSDGQHLRMAGYPARVKSWSWSSRGRYLATSGAMVAVLWPFLDRDGPMGQPPLELGARSQAMVTCVACHPREEMVAIGYDDGMILFVRFIDQREVLLRRSDGGAITTMNWDTAGVRLAFGSDKGSCGLIDIGS